jgi:hypothetical protein
MAQEYREYFKPSRRSNGPKSARPCGVALEITHAFFDAREAKFVNGLLDAVAKDVR